MNELRLRITGARIKSADAEAVLAIAHSIVSALLEADQGGSPSTAKISFRDIQPGSINLVFGTTSILRNTRAVFTAVRNHDGKTLSSEAVKSLQCARDKMVEAGYTGVCLESSKLGSVLIDGGTHFDRCDEPTELRGESVLYGELRTVGDICRVLTRGRVVPVRCAPAIAEELKSRLFAPIGLEGEATWDTETYRVTRFQAKRVLPYKPIAPEDAVDAVREAFGECLSEWTAEEIMEELRGEE